jgi:hypothetical protein
VAIVLNALMVSSTASDDEVTEENLRKALEAQAAASAADQSTSPDPNQLDPDDYPNKLHHIFNSRSHDTKNLKALSSQLGSDQAAYQAIRSAAAQEIRAQGLGSGIYRVNVSVGGRPFTVQGTILDNGTVRIGTMW